MNSAKCFRVTNIIWSNHVTCKMMWKCDKNMPQRKRRLHWHLFVSVNRKTWKNLRPQTLDVSKQNSWLMSCLMSHQWKHCDKDNAPCQFTSLSLAKEESWEKKMIVNSQLFVILIEYIIQFTPQVCKYNSARPIVCRILLNLLDLFLTHMFLESLLSI